MLISIEWLSDLVDISGLDAKEIAEALTMSGLEVEDIEYIKPKFSRVYVGEIIDIAPHPEADKIRLATVDYGSGQQQVVCGAQNIKLHQIVPFAIEGATVFNRKTGEEFVLKKAKIRGFESSGMICSANELCLEGKEYEPFADGILALSEMERFKDTKLERGVQVEKVLNLPEDIVLHTAPTANRGDLMSMRGVAHEVAAIFNRPMKSNNVEINENSCNANEHFTVEIIDEDTCKYYSLGIVKDVAVKSSPDWMKRRLESSGMRAINNIVDITNYVMLEFGQPLHAFDFNKLTEKYLCVRRAKENEKITTLDGVTRELVSENVLIAAPDRPVALGGVMGDESSEVDDSTRSLAIESAYFTPATNRRSSRKAGIRTEACARFERGVDIKSVKLALKRTMQLMVELAEAKTCGIYETGEDNLEPLYITLRFTQIKKVLGIEVPIDRALQILQDLGFNLSEKTESFAKFEVPTYRVVDVTREIDLIEEISRIYGYDKIEESIPGRTQLPQLPEEYKLINTIHTVLRANGLNEIVTSSLTGYPLLNWCSMPANEETVIKVTNPQSEEYTMLRQSMVPSILQVIKYNIDHDIKDVWVFEVGKTYFKDHEPDDKDPGTKENLILAGAITGNNYNGRWHHKQTTDFYNLKGVIENLFEYLGLNKRIEFISAKDVDYLHPGRSAFIKVLGGPKGDSSLGFPYSGILGELHPELNSRCKIGQPVYIFQIDLRQLVMNLPKTETVYKKVSQFPAVERDIAFVIDQSIPYAEIVKVIKKASSILLENIEIFDVYTGANIEEGKRSLAFSLRLMDRNATLTDELVEKEVQKVKESLKKAFNIKLRE